MADGNISNEKFIVQKADTTMSTIAPNGVLAPEYAKEFFEIVTHESRFLNQCTVKTFTAPSYEYPKIGFTGEVVKPAIEAEGLTQEDRSAPVFEKVTLVPREYIAICRTTYSALEDNIEREALQPHLVRLAGEAVRRDMEKAAIQGDTANASGTRLIRYQDGILKQTTTSIVDAANARLSGTPLTACLRKIPEQFMQDTSGYKVFTAKNPAIDFNASFSTRETAGGDNAFQQGFSSPQRFFGMPVEWIPLFPSTLGGSSNQSVALICNPKNFLVGFRRQVDMRWRDDIENRQYVIVITFRVDFKWIEERGAGKVINILASAE